ncbi:hypothetical protein JB92DRAFT_3097410 [Gautieria morchelliformis]|nr:hypothetical protein JB92DRAFT_3097410 [Gautieria morchelliformis]
MSFYPRFCHHGSTPHSCNAILRIARVERANVEKPAEKIAPATRRVSKTKNEKRKTKNEKLAPEITETENDVPVLVGGGSEPEAARFCKLDYSYLFMQNMAKAFRYRLVAVLNRKQLSFVKIDFHASLRPALPLGVTAEPFTYGGRLLPVPRARALPDSPNRNAVPLGRQHHLQPQNGTVQKICWQCVAGAGTIKGPRYPAAKSPPY